MLELSPKWTTLDLKHYCLVGWMDDYNGHFKFHVQLLLVLYIIWIKLDLF